MNHLADFPVLADVDGNFKPISGFSPIYNLINEVKLKTDGKTN